MPTIELENKYVKMKYIYNSSTITDFAYQISMSLRRVDPCVRLDTSLGSQNVCFLLGIQITLNSVK